LLDTLLIIYDFFFLRRKRSARLPKSGTIEINIIQGIIFFVFFRNTSKMLSPPFFFPYRPQVGIQKQKPYLSFWETGLRMITPYPHLRVQLFRSTVCWRSKPYQAH